MNYGLQSCIRGRFLLRGLGRGSRLGRLNVLRPREQQLEITVEVVETVGRDLRTSLCFSKDERSLNHGLHVERETLWSPIGWNAMQGDGRSNVRLQSRRVRSQVLVASAADRRVGYVDFLNHGAKETSELGEFAGKDGFAEVDVAQKAIDRIGQASIGSGSKNALCKDGEMFSGRKGEILLAFEVMEEAAFAETSRCADVVNRRGFVTFRANNVNRRVEELLSGKCEFFMADGQ